MKQVLLFLVVVLLSISAASSRYGVSELGEQYNLRSWGNTGAIFQLAQAPSPAVNGGTLVLAAKRTARPDVTRRFKLYLSGWDFTNPHYWASVGFTGAAGFILAALWFLSFGLALAAHHFYKRRIKIKSIGSNRSLHICLILLLVFTCAAAIGCILLSIGQSEFHGEVLQTLKYVVNQSDYTVQTLRNVTAYLSLAKNINIDQVFLPSDVKDEIDKLNVDLNNAADMLNEKTSENSSKIRNVIHIVRSALIVVAAVMLLLSLLGLLLSILGHQHAIYIFIWSGWLLVAVTFILCGIFLVLNNVTADTCMAMEEWVDNPQAETALSNILPCVDQRTTNKTLIQSKEVINQLVNVVNTVIYTFVDTNPPPQAAGFYYNQSGPMVPPLCSPFDSKLQDRACEPQEVSLANASLVWQNYTCTVWPSGICSSMGRITPEMYRELVEAVNVSYGLNHYAPPLLNLQNCDFVRDTFSSITSHYCRPLQRYLQMVVAGLGLISVGVMLCLILWILYANRPQREDAFVKQLLPGKLFHICRNSKSNKNTSQILEYQ